MLKVTFTTSELRFENSKTGSTVSVVYEAFPEIFGHPRHPISNLAMAVPVLRESLKRVAGFRLLAPKVKVHIDRPLLGGETDVDRQVIKAFFVYAGARKVEIS